MKVTYKLTTGEYKSKIIGELELPEISRKMLEARIKGKIVYWWKEQTIDWRKEDDNKL